LHNEDNEESSLDSDEKEELKKQELANNIKKRQEKITNVIQKKVDIRAQMRSRMLAD